MTRAPASGAVRGGGLLSGPNLPYSLTTVVALAVLVAFVLMTDPFATGTESTGIVSGDLAAGEATFINRCSVCHGPGGEGIIGLGKPLTASEFAAGLTDEELLAFLIVGRASDDPANTTGIVMPGRAGVPPLSDEELIDVIAYLRTLNAG